MHTGRGLCRWLFALLLFAIPCSAALAVQSADNRLVELHADEAAVFSTGYRLAAAAGNLCHDQLPAIGLEIEDLDQYQLAFRARARSEFGLGDLPAVLAVAEEGPADRAGIRPGDAIAAVNGAPVPAGGGLERVQQLLAAIDTAATLGPVTLGLVRGQLTMSVTVPPERRCATRFQTRPSPDLQALANGNYVEVTTGLVAFASGEDQLAAILAHELAHNILHHRTRLAAAGRTTSRIRQTEEEADRLSVYLIDRAGYSSAATLAFWRRLTTAGRRAPRGLRTHLPGKERLNLIAKEVARLNRLKAAGEEPRPAFMQGPTLPALR